MVYYTKEIREKVSYSGRRLSEKLREKGWFLFIDEVEVVVEAPKQITQRRGVERKWWF